MTRTGACTFPIPLSFPQAANASKLRLFVTSQPSLMPPSSPYGSTNLPALAPLSPLIIFDAEDPAIFDGSTYFAVVYSISRWRMVDGSSGAVALSNSSRGRAEEVG
ncbi:hypothetical protein BDQ12DRAFT_378201 [Crucibulum laeve]|uniref:Uncharacterized protein n=1 Tax=Crucibulum laeve TaxID=68775 RepID=A0A5C3LMU6_9AGAR|nr:hypothetical protein BDQ12DRAFT_378201 [Crucibulum laeve]